MTRVCPWPGFAFETNPGKIVAAGLRLSADFAGTTFQGIELSDDQAQEYRVWAAASRSATPTGGSRTPASTASAPTTWPAW